MKATNNYLRITSASLIWSFVYFLMNSTKNIPECLLSICLLATIICSQLFWQNPIKTSIIHKIDAYVAKISMLFFILYTLTYKNIRGRVLYSYLLFLCGLLFTSYNSNYYSAQEWCSDKHIFHHGCLHMVCYLGSFYAF